MIKTLIDFSEKYGLLPRGSRILCAVSGGADSIAMLHMLYSVRDILEIDLVCAHYNHGIRELAKRDEQFVKDFCSGIGVPFYCGYGNVPAQAEAAGEGLEEAARRMRYGYLEEVCDLTGAERIATAHTADDMIETVLMNFARGSGSLGAAGIPPVRGRIVRPMLELTRADIEKYIEKNGLSHIEDETNADEQYTRNRIRKQIAPVLKSVNSKAAENFSATALRIREDCEFLDEMAKELIRDVEITDEGQWINTKVLTDSPRPLAARCIAEMCGGLSSRQVEAVLKLASSALPSAKIDLADGITARREYDRLFIGKNEEKLTFSPRPVNLAGKTEIPELGITIYCSKSKKTEKIHNSINTFIVGCDIIYSNFIVRPRKEGDEIKLKGRPTKSLKKLFIELCISKYKRQTIPVLADDRGVVAVYGIGQDVRRTVGEDVFIIRMMTEEK